MLRIITKRALVALCLLLLFGTSAAQASTKSSERAALNKLGAGIDSLVLTDTQGQARPWSSFKGKPHILFFGFTHCPVVCPVTVWEIDAALADVGEPAKDLKITFVTLDPKRDTAAEMAKYFSGFKGRVIALRGADDAIAKLAKSFDVTWQRVDTGKGEYTIDHTALAFLIDGRGTVTDTLAFGAARELSVERIKALLARSTQK